MRANQDQIQFRRHGLEERVRRVEGLAEGLVKHEREHSSGSRMTDWQLLEYVQHLAGDNVIRPAKGQTHRCHIEVVAGASFALGLAMGRLGMGEA
ncbi:MAG: hypothetical protein ABJA98_12410 [Acidobacteriota bacterium]